MNQFRRHLISLLFAMLSAPTADAAVGLSELAADATSGPVTLLYPTDDIPTVVERSSFKIEAAVDAVPKPGNHHLVAISHGSPASVWVYYDLVSALVDAGYTVVLPLHAHDNSEDDRDAGPTSWQRRPLEISAAIDRVQADPRFQALNFNDVGMYGMSAGGHTALVLAGGHWSKSQLRAHCEAHIEEDFHACAGPDFSLDGGWFDGLKLWIFGWVLSQKLDDDTMHAHADPRIKAIVVGVPFAADFDMESLRQPSVPVGIITVRQDRWLNVKFHGDAVLAACAPCEHLLDIENAGHGALLSPISPLPQAEGSLVADPSGFNRTEEVPRINSAIVAFFEKRLTAE